MHPQATTKCNINASVLDPRYALSLLHCDPLELRGVRDWWGEDEGGEMFSEELPQYLHA